MRVSTYTLCFIGKLFSVNTQCIVANVIKVFYMGYEDFQIPFWMFVIVCSFT